MMKQAILAFAGAIAALAVSVALRHFDPPPQPEPAAEPQRFVAANDCYYPVRLIGRNYFEVKTECGAGNEVYRNDQIIRYRFDGGTTVVVRHGGHIIINAE